MILSIRFVLLLFSIRVFALHHPRLFHMAARSSGEGWRTSWGVSVVQTFSMSSNRCGIKFFAGTCCATISLFFCSYQMVSITNADAAFHHSMIRLPHYHQAGGCKFIVAIDLGVKYSSSYRASFCWAWFAPPPTSHGTQLQAPRNSTEIPEWPPPGTRIFSLLITGVTLKLRFLLFVRAHPKTRRAGLLAVRQRFSPEQAGCQPAGGEATPPHPWGQYHCGTPFHASCVKTGGLGMIISFTIGAVCFCSTMVQLNLA